MSCEVESGELFIALRAKLWRKMAVFSFPKMQFFSSPYLISILSKCRAWQLKADG